MDVIFRHYTAGVIDTPSFNSLITLVCLQPNGTDTELPAPIESQPVATSASKSKTKKPPTAEVLLARRKKLWHSIVKKDISKAAKAHASARKELLSNAKKVCGCICVNT